eukprot:m.135502 g.135502  ORF g.135502 m.135502 type:complete len:581 (+) comp14872_c1_seq1:106-1848(+)
MASDGEMDFEAPHEASVVMNSGNPFVGAAIPVSMIMMPTPLFDNGGLSRLPPMPLYVAPPGFSGPPPPPFMDMTGPTGMPQPINTHAIIQELQDLDNRIHTERAATQNAIYAMGHCDPSAMPLLKTKLSSSASRLDSLLQQKRHLQARVATLVPPRPRDPPAAPPPPPPPPASTAQSGDGQTRENSTRLAVLSRRLAAPSTFAASMEELIGWCRDPRAFSATTAEPLRHCLATARHNSSHSGFDPELCSRLFDVCKSHINVLPPEILSEVQLWYANRPYVTGPAAASGLAMAVPPAQAPLPDDPYASINLFVKIGDPLIPAFQLRHGIKTHQLSFTLPQDFEDLFYNRSDLILGLRSFFAHDRRRAVVWSPYCVLKVNSFPMHLEIGSPVDLRGSCHTGLNIIQIETKFCSCSLLYECCVLQKVPLGYVERFIEKKAGTLAQDRETNAKMHTATHRISLICPVSKKRIVTPVRSRECRHIQTYDMRSFLLLVSKSSNWLCPVCGIFINYATLFQDAHITSILAVLPQASAVDIATDGSYTEAPSITAAPPSTAVSQADDTVSHMNMCDQQPVESASSLEG